MLFNSYLFIFAFLPIVLIFFTLFGKFKTPILQMVWLSFCSCFFYAYWKPIFLLLLMTSVFVNYFIACSLMRNKNKRLFILGICFNIAVIAYFKYRGFLLANFNAITSSQFKITDFILPLGISFITFQKIAYLVDVYRGKVVEKNFLRFLVFISFFPQLIAGPIVHYNPLMSQFSKKSSKKLRYENLAKGSTLFVIGLAKKVLIADTMASYADGAFAAAMSSVHLTFLESWIGVLAYTMQIYFDFSGYSDMAIGLALMFGIRLPINFNSPYQSENIIDFWRRWHITLSTFLKDYIYIPLGGNRRGNIRKFFNLITTMLIGGLWHGANWTFVIWGGIHGTLLTINHLWQQLCDQIGIAFIRKNIIYKFVSRAITFVSVAIAWIYFRMPNYKAIKYMLNGIIGKNGFITPENSYLNSASSRLGRMLVDHKILGHKISSLDPVFMPLSILFVVLFIVFVMPNSQQMMRIKFFWPRTTLRTIFAWKPRPFYLAGTLTLFYTCLIFMTDLNFKPFAYFAF